MFRLRQAVLPLLGHGTTARPRGTTMEDHGTSAAAAEAGTSLTERSTTARAVLPLPLAVLPQGRDVPDFEKAQTYKNTFVATSAELESMQKSDMVVP